jgi:ribonuclease VapC
MSSGAVILDASAVLAYLLGERGAEEVFTELENAAISAVNWAEVVQRSLELEAWADSMRAEFEASGAQVVPVEVSHAERAAHMREATRNAGLSLADRICFALAASRECPLLTADRAWADLDVGVDVRLIR